MDTGHSDDPAGTQADRTLPEGVANGPGAAAVLAAGIGSLALGVFAFAGDASPPIRRVFNIWDPSGPLSGVTSGAVLVWLVAWYMLARRWATRDVGLTSVTIARGAHLPFEASLLLHKRGLLP